jgi:uncharacterized protein YecT (DUF1311 family)
MGSTTGETVNGKYTHSISMRDGKTFWHYAFILTSILFFTTKCWSLDNPDASDFVGDFEKKASAFENTIYQSNDNRSEVIKNHAAYEKFLDAELNSAYVFLEKKMQGAAKKQFLISQRQWLKYRDSELSYITINWDDKNFGSSHLISRNSYKVSLIKERVIRLLHYLKNYRP